MEKKVVDVMKNGKFRLTFGIENHTIVSVGFFTFNRSAHAL